MSSRIHHWNAPTLTSAELDVDTLGVDDQLVLRDVKARLFDREVPVTIGRYPIERRIGRGGMGTVYEAQDSELGRTVALKVMLPGDANAARTKAEARTLAQLSHPNVVTVHEVGQHGERVFLAMEYVEGETLGEWLARPHSREAILEVFAQAGEGLAAAHETGTAHRDFKPSNVLIREDGRVKVIDFGLSQAGASETPSLPELDARLTRTGALLGTPAYMSPEQFRGEEVDARTDVFSFAVALYEALAGERPYGGDDVESMRAAVLSNVERPRRPKTLTRRLWTALEAALEVDVQRRPTTLRPLLDAMNNRQPRLGMVAVGSAVLLAGLTAAGLALGPAPDEHEPEPVDTVRARAFADLRDTTDGEERQKAAEAFLAAYGDDATSAERLVAVAAIGLALRDRACPSNIDGLCVQEVRHEDDADRCPQFSAVSWTAIPRDAELMREAEEHLTRARHLMSFQRPPEAPRDAVAYGQAIAAVKLATTDDDLEALLATTIPNVIDFNDGGPNPELNREAFQAILTSASNDAKRITAAYGTLKPGDRRFVLRAAGRTAITHLSFTWLLSSIPTPSVIEPEDRTSYCNVMVSQWEAPVKVARDAVAYCENLAKQAELDDAVCNLAPEGFPQVVP